MAKAKSGTQPRRGTQRPSKRKNDAAKRGRVTIRHYCQGIGDCHLLRFPTGGGDDFWMLIDCGVHSSVAGGSKMIDRVVADIAAQTQRLDVVVLTHEHMDHISGFRSAAEVFKNFTIGEVWMAWTEDPENPQVRELDKFKQQALDALQMTSQRLDGAPTMSAHLGSLRNGLDALLGFNFGVKGERVRAARDAAVALAEKPVRYWEPKHSPIEIPTLAGVRIYVLGPPRDVKLFSVTERTSEMYGAAGGPGWPIARSLMHAFAGGDAVVDAGSNSGAPFDPNVGTDLSKLADSGAAAPPDDLEPTIAAFARDYYFGQAATAGPVIRSRRRKKADPNEHDQSWRRIDLDWLAVSAELAMQLDDRTNNTCLVLAFEFVDTKRVLLFAADAQVGNWLSWQDTRWTVDGETVTGPDLLARTVYYKVGHHGSHNATLKEKGLELMTDADLSAFIPTNAKDAKKVGWGQMPFGPIVDALAERCAGRVIRADDPWISGAEPGPTFGTTGSIRKLTHGDGLWVEVEVS